MTKALPAPVAVIEFVKCGCSKQRCSSNRCQCRKAGLTCTELCSCSDADELCENVQERDDSDDCSDDDDIDDKDSDTDT